jgi:hypothetical protein
MELWHATIRFLSSSCLSAPSPSIHFPAQSPGIGRKKGIPACVYPLLTPYGIFIPQSLNISQEVELSFESNREIHTIPCSIKHIHTYTHPPTHPTTASQPASTPPLLLSHCTALPQPTLPVSPYPVPVVAAELSSHGTTSINLSFGVVPDAEACEAEPEPLTAAAGSELGSWGDLDNRPPVSEGGRKREGERTED